MSIPLGERPQESRGTVIRIPVTSEGTINPNAPGAEIRSTEVQEDFSKLHVRVFFPASAVVGHYYLAVLLDTKDEEDQHGSVMPQEPRIHKFDYPVYVLFNPWCKG